MKKCKVCGGSCSEIGGGKYQCDFCGETFSADDFESRPKAGNAGTRPQSTADSDLGADIFEKNVNGVLEISMSTGNASGYLISASGYGITNSHAVALDNGKSCGQCKVKVAGETVSATVVAMGTQRNDMHCTNDDLALIRLARVPAYATPLTFGDYNRVRTGERIFVIGNSLGEGTCITSGIVSDKDRGGQLMYDCPTNPGNSGGPVFNSEGQVIGTHVAGRSPNGVKVQGMNYAIPVSAVEAFLRRAGFNFRK